MCPHSSFIGADILPSPDQQPGVATLATSVSWVTEEEWEEVMASEVVT